MESLVPTTAPSEDDWDKVSDEIPAEEEVSEGIGAEANAAAAADTAAVRGTKDVGVDVDADAETGAKVTERQEESNANLEADANTNININGTPDSPSTPTALQIVSIGTESDEYAFTYHDEALQSIMKQVPETHKVCVVSVVGAFRTGKSFLLSWFLRYLNHYEGIHQNSKEDANSNANGSGNGKINDGDETKWYEQQHANANANNSNDASLGNDGFNWRGGAERNTTGIWMWSKPFILPRNQSGNSEDIAVLLVDTQGMFDHETTMGLTAAIFGLSTLLSSYQIYNVDKRIQEDNLQQLALFSEYGKMALQSNVNDDNDDGDDDDNFDSIEDELGLVEKPKPFQRIEFLVRDWQNFDDEDDIDACEAEMKAYLDNVLAERAAADLKDTRLQITSCFDEVSCFLMTHPGSKVTKKTYTGDIKDVDPTFKALMDRYCNRVFENLVAKSIHRRELTAAELGAYIQNYAKMFESGAQFPEAATMLEATANANNSNATNLAMRKYKEEMDNLAGARCVDYLNPEELEQSHRNLFEDCVGMFESIACFGNIATIQDAKNEMIRSMEENFEMYTKLNDSRNPLSGFETYILPLCIGVGSVILRWITDFTCTSWSQTCKVGSDVLLHIYQVVFFFIIIIAATKAKQIGDALTRVKKALEVMSENGGSKDKKD